MDDQELSGIPECWRNECYERATWMGGKEWMSELNYEVERVSLV